MRRQGGLEPLGESHHPLPSSLVHHACAPRLTSSVKPPPFLGTPQQANKPHRQRAPPARSPVRKLICRSALLCDCLTSSRTSRAGASGPLDEVDYDNDPFIHALNAKRAKVENQVRVLQERIVEQTVDGPSNQTH